MTHVTVRALSNSLVSTFAILVALGGARPTQAEHQPAVAAVRQQCMFVSGMVECSILSISLSVTWLLYLVTPHPHELRDVPREI